MKSRCSCTKINLSDSSTYRKIDIEEDCPSEKGETFIQCMSCEGYESVPNFWIDFTREFRKTSKALLETIHKSQVKEDDGDHRLTLRLPKWLLEKIDQKRKLRVGNISRNLWILEQIEKSIEEDSIHKEINGRISTKNQSDDLLHRFRRHSHKPSIFHSKG